MHSWRKLTINDIEDLMRVGDVVHPDLPETADVFAERLKLYPNGCLVLEVNGQICGYAVSHPIRKHQPPALNTLLGEIVPDADAYYIHDVAILPGFRGRGLAGEGIGRLLEVARSSGFEVTSLVSVYGTEHFWSRFGFKPEDVGHGLREKLCGYGDDAVFLSRSSSQKDILSHRGS